MSGIMSLKHGDRISQVYNNGSIHVPNKYIVGLWGEAIRGAVQYMSDYASIDPLKTDSTKITNDVRIYSGILSRWINIHCPNISVSPASFSNGYGRDIINKIDTVELLWACEKISFPSTITPTFDDKMMLDTYKNVKYPIVTGHSGPGSITLTITEDRTLMFYQFFNAIMNQFFDPLILKARSSIHKMGIYIMSLDGFDFPGIKENTIDERGLIRGEDDNINGVGYTISDVPLQVFEFNSVVLESVGNLSYEYGADKKATFEVKIKAPNLFQDAFKTMGNFRGMANNTSDTQINGSVSFDKTSLLSSDTSIKYNSKMFEESSPNNPHGNGNYTHFI